MWKLVLGVALFVMKDGFYESHSVRHLYAQRPGLQGFHHDLHVANEHLHAGRGTLGIKLGTKMATV